MEEQHNTQQPEPEAGGYEKKDVNVVWITTIALLVIALVATFAVVLNEYFLITKERLIYENVLKPERADIRELRARETEALNSYKVLTAVSIRYQIPVSRAMELMAEESFQTRKTEQSK